MVSKTLFSSGNSEWETPQWLFNQLDQEYHFTLDVCATRANTKCIRYISPEIDGLSQSWAGEICWMNPPYGRDIARWVQKAYEESLKGATVVCLLPARTDTRWFHNWVLGKAEIRFLPGRLKFGGAKHGAPFPSLIAVFHPGGEMLKTHQVR